MAPDDEGQSTPPVGPALPIVASVLALVGFVPAAVVALFSVFASDPGLDRISIWARLFIMASWLTPVLCLVGAIASWVVWGVSRRRRGGVARTVRGITYLLPLIGVVLIGIAWFGTEVFCGGSLTC